MSRINHSACRWCYGEIPLEDLCIAAKDIGISSIELVMPDDIPVLEKHGLSCAMMSFPVGKMADGTEVGRGSNPLDPSDDVPVVGEGEGEGEGEADPTGEEAPFVPGVPALPPQPEPLDLSIAGSAMYACGATSQGDAALPGLALAAVLMSRRRRR